MENIYLKRAEELKEELVAHRRQIHGYAETEFDLPQTLALVEKELRSYGYEPVRVGRAGISCTVGKPGRCLLLRADMDALPMQEETGCDFAAANGHCHSCGHDCHTAMLLCAAKMLKEREAFLEGTVKFMFQPAEEKLAGAQDMIDAGILENPKVDAAVGLHVAIGWDNSDLGRVLYARGPAMYAANAIRIRVEGKSAHGSTPFAGVDAITIAAHIVIALQEILAREIPCTDHSIVTIGKIHGGDTENTIGGHAEMWGAIRTTSYENLNFLLKRVQEISAGVAETYRGKAVAERVYGIGPLYNDPALSDQIGGYCREVVGEDKVDDIGTRFGTEDFAVIGEKVPSVMLNIGAGSIEEGYDRTLHHAGMTLNEDVLPLGAAVYAHCAEQYLKETK
jgi:amidohydrolase